MAVPAIRILRYLLSVFMLMASLALLPVAVDWRSPFLADVRPWLFGGMIFVSLGLTIAQIWVLRTTDRKRTTAWWLSSLGLLAAIFALSSTLALEARFYWVRYQVLHADTERLEKLGRHLIVGYRDLAEIRELVALRAIAGIFVAGRNVQGKSGAQVRQEIDSLQRIRRQQGLPRLWVATDQEGGIVSRLSPPLTRQPALSKIVDSISARSLSGWELNPPIIPAPVFLENRCNGPVRLS